MSTPATQPLANPAGDQDWEKLVVQQVASMRFGAVEIIVHDGQVIQIEATERVRLGKTPSGDQSRSH
jgi:hypothetical protein